MTVRKHKFTHLPDHKTRISPAYLYAVEFHDGTVKVGVTWNPSNRVVVLQRVYGRRAVRVHVAPYSKSQRYQAERAALDVCGRIGTPIKGHGELFANVKFGEAATAITQMSRRKFLPPVPPSILRRSPAARLKYAKALRTLSDSRRAA